MGRAKPLLEWDGRPLLARAAEAALGGGARPVIVVLGAEAERVRSCLSGLSLQAVVNPDWSTGMASSLRCGLQALLAAAPDIGALLVALCDQPACRPTSSPGCPNSKPRRDGSPRHGTKGATGRRRSSAGLISGRWPRSPAMPAPAPCSMEGRNRWPPSTCPSLPSIWTDRRTSRPGRAASARPSRRGGIRIAKGAGPIVSKGVRPTRNPQADRPSP